MKLQNSPKVEKKHATESKPSNKGKRRISFKITAPAASNVFIAGAFNDWNPASHPLTDKERPGEFQRYLYLEPGTVEYKFVVDGEWQIDPGCPNWTPNSAGSLNSVVKI